MLSSKEKIKKHFMNLQSPYASNSNWIWTFVRNREKSLFHELVRNLKKDICLDLGAGLCEYSKILLNMGAKYSVCVDFNPLLMSEIQEPRIEKIFCDVETFKTNKKYDLILCMGIIEFLDFPKNFMLRLREFLKPKGKLIILLPYFKAGSFIYAFIYLLKGIFIPVLTLKKMNIFLIKNGFFLEEMTTNNFFSGLAVYSVCPIKDKK